MKKLYVAYGSNKEKKRLCRSGCGMEYNGE